MKRRGPNGAGTVYRESGRRWCSEAYVDLPDGRRKRVKGRGKTPEEATQARLAATRRLLESNPEADKMSVKQLSERWFEAREGGWKSATIVSYRTALDKHILPELGGAKVTRVTGMDVQRVLSTVMRKSGGEHVALANRCRRVMHALFAQAVRWGVVPRNPVESVEKVAGPERERGWWTHEQALTFLAATNGSRYHEVFWAALTTGLRVGELMALRWRDIDAGLVTVRRTYSQTAKGKIQEAPKTKRSRRSVPIPDALRLALEARRGKPDELVFTTRHGSERVGGGMMNLSNIRRALIHFAGRAGVPVIRVHDLRRTYASLLAAEGYHPSVIQRLLGHASPDLAMRVYTSVTDARVESAVIDLPGGENGSSRTDTFIPFRARMTSGVGAEDAPESLN